MRIIEDHFNFLIIVLIVVKEATSLKPNIFSLSLHFPIGQFFPPSLWIKNPFPRARPKICLRILLLGLIILASAALHSRPLRDTIDPLEQMRKWLHFVVGKAGERPAFNPGPGANIGD